VSELAEAVRIMAKVQLDQDLDTAEVRSIVAFLQALTGDVPANYSDPFADAKASTNRHNERGN
jgi:cytochrome c peroxidase